MPNHCTKTGIGYQAARVHLATHPEDVAYHCPICDALHICSAREVGGRQVVMAVGASGRIVATIDGIITDVR